jgi:hypothetical protein
MKRLIITLILVILSVGICFSTSFYVSSVAGESKKYVSRAKECMTENQYKAALNEVSSFEDYWEENQSFLAMILHHEMLEEIGESIAIMKSSLQHSDEEFTDFWNEFASVNKKIDNLKKCEKNFT